MQINLTLFTWFRLPCLICGLLSVFFVPQDLSIGTLIDEPISSYTVGGSYYPSCSDHSNSGLNIQPPPSINRRWNVLPPIDTFSHQEFEPRFNKQERSKHYLRSKTRHIRTPGTIQKGVKSLFICKNGTNTDERLFLCPVPSCTRAKPEAAFKRRYLLREHLNFHRREKPYCCDRCPQRFTSRQNLARHRLIHAGVTYTCSECRYVFPRSSDRSKCLRNHKLQRIISEQGSCTAPVSAFATPKKPPTASTVAITGPYVCPVCTDQRGYKLDSSLRKHMRLHHPTYKSSTSAQVEQIFGKIPTQSVVDSQRHQSSLVGTTVVNYSLKTPTITVAPDPTTSQLPISLTTDTGAYLLSSGNVLYAVDPQYAAIDQFLPIVGTAGVDTTEEQRTAIFMELAPDGSATVDERSRRPAHNTVLGVTEVPLLLTHCIPIDLCTTALCLAVTDPSLPASLAPTSHHPAAIRVETEVCSSIASEGALDLTDLPHEIIDLSHSDPVDLSSTHPQPPRPVLWEPEPGFSFTDLLNVDDEDPRGLLLGSEFKVGLDLRLSEPM